MYERRFITYNEKYGIGYIDNASHECFYAESLQGEINDDYEFDRQSLPLNTDTQYALMGLDILRYGKERTDRTGTGTIGVFGYQARFDLQYSFPLLTTKKVHFKGIVGELLWFLSGCKGGIAGLKSDYGVTIWDEWQQAENEGKRIPYKDMVNLSNEIPFAESINQLQIAINQIKNNPDSRRIIVCHWNPQDAANNFKWLVLPPCHVLFQFYVSDGVLSCEMFQRSADYLLGVPFNIASYALLTHMVAKECGLQVGELIISYGDLHIYKNHIEQVKTQLMRMPKTAPKIELADVKNIWSYSPSDIKLIGYDPHPAIVGKVSV